MDELEFRRRAIAHPMDKDPEFLDAAQATPANHKHLAEMKALSNQLYQVMAVEIPAGLAERILLRQAMESDEDAPAQLPPPPHPRKRWRPLALAASVAFLLGMSTRWVGLPPTPPTEPALAQIALAHLYGEEPFIKDVDEQVSLATLNAKLAKYGATLPDMQDLKVNYANHCAFYQGPALHLVIQGSLGPITLFLVPKQLPIRLQPYFDDGRLKGEIVPLKGANMVLIGAMQEPLAPVAEAFERRLRWSI